MHCLLEPWTVRRLLQTGDYLRLDLLENLQYTYIHMLHIVGEGDNFLFDLILDHIAVVM